MDAIPVLDWYEHEKGESTIRCHSHLHPSFLSLSVIPISIRNSREGGNPDSVSEHGHRSASNSDESNKTT